LLKAWLRMSQNQATGDGGTCYGDSGGPAFWTDPDTGTEVLVGVTSWGDAPCVSSAFNYRVDIPETLDFIADVIAGLD
ncbi:MAG: trypsin-like serine protease, partial [Anaerolineae bacterium]